LEITLRDRGFLLSVLAILILTSAKSANAEPVKSVLCFVSCPNGSPISNKLIEHHLLVLSANLKTKFSDWVAYRITQQSIGKKCPRVWARDPDLSYADTLVPKDYVGVRKYLNSDRGHQAPLASLCASPYWAEANYLSNITPQHSELNQGPWEHLEQAERNLVLSMKTNDVYSTTGPLFERLMPTLPNAHVAHIVPSGYWKVVVAKTNGNYRLAAFVMEQTLSRSSDFCQSSLPLSEIERRAHLTFFSGLPKAVKDKLRAVQNSLKPGLGCLN